MSSVLESRRVGEARGCSESAFGSLERFVFSFSDLSGLHHRGVVAKGLVTAEFGGG